MALREQAALEVLVGGRYGGMAGMQAFENDLNRISGLFHKTFVDPWKSPQTAIGEQWARSMAAAEKAATARKDAEIAEQKVISGGTSLRAQYEQSLVREAQSLTAVEKAQRRLTDAREAEQQARNRALTAPTATHANQFSATKAREARQLAEQDLANAKMSADAMKLQRVAAEQNLPVQEAMLSQAAAKRLKYANDMEAAAKKEEDAARSFERSMRIHTTFGRVNSVANAGILVGGGITGAAVYSGFQDLHWLQGVKQVGALTNMSPAEQAWLAKYGPSLMGQMGANQDQILSGFRVAREGGFRNQNALNLVRTILKSAIPTGADPYQLGFTLEGLLNQFGYHGNEAVANSQRILDYIHTAAATGHMTTDQFANNFGQIGGFASLAKSPDVMLQAMALFSTMTQEHIPYAQASTQVRGFLQQLMMPRPAARQILDELKAQGNPLYKDFSAQGLAQRGLPGVLEDIAKSNLTPQEMQKIYPNMRGILTAFLATTPEGRSVYRQTYDQIGNAPNFEGKGATQSEYNQWKNSPAGQIAQFQGSVKQLEIALGQGVLPEMVKFVQLITPIIKGVTQWADANKNTVEWITKIGAVLLGASLAVRGFTFLFEPLVGWLVTGETKMKLLSAAVKYGGTIMDAFSSQLGLVTVKGDLSKTALGDVNLAMSHMTDTMKAGNPIIGDAATELEAAGTQAELAGTKAETANGFWGNLLNNFRGTKAAADTAVTGFSEAEAGTAGLIGTTGSVTVGAEGAIAGSAGTGLLGVVGALAAIIIGMKFAGDAMKHWGTQAPYTPPGGSGPSGVPLPITKDGKMFVLNPNTGYWTDRNGDILGKNGNIITPGSKGYPSGGYSDTGSASWGTAGHIGVGTAVPTASVFGMPNNGTPLNEISNPNYPGGRSSAIALAGVRNATVHSDIPEPVGTDVKLPGGNRARYFLVQTGYDRQGGNFELWQTPNGGRFIFFHLSNNNVRELAGTGNAGKVGWYTGGTTVAKSGNTGSNTSGAHLHVGMDAQAEAYVYGQSYGEGWNGNPYVGGTSRSTGSAGMANMSGSPATAGVNLSSPYVSGWDRSNFGNLQNVSGNNGITMPEMLTLLQMESTGGMDKNAGNNVMQVTWAAAQAMGLYAGFDPRTHQFVGTKQQSLQLGAAYFAYLLNGPAHGDVQLAFQMYNGSGPKAVAYGKRAYGVYQSLSFGAGNGAGSVQASPAGYQTGSGSNWGPNAYGAYPNEVGPDGLPIKPKGSDPKAWARYWWLRANADKALMHQTFPDPNAWKFLTGKGLALYERQQGSVYYDEEQQRLNQVHVWWNSLSPSQRADPGYQAAYNFQINQAKKTYGASMSNMQADAANAPLYRRAFWMQSNYQNLHDIWGSVQKPWTLGKDEQKRWLQGERSMDWYWAQYEAANARIREKQLMKEGMSRKDATEWLAKRLHAIWAEQHQKDINALHKLTQHGQTGAAGRVVPVHVVGHCAAEAAANQHRSKGATASQKTAEHTQHIEGHIKGGNAKLDKIHEALEKILAALHQGSSQPVTGFRGPTDPRFRGGAHRPRSK